MINHSTRMRDFLEISRGARLQHISQGVRLSTESRETPELKRKRADSEERRMLKKLIGDDPWEAN